MTQELIIWLPINYVNLGPIALHVHDLARYTADVERFQKYLPATMRMLDAEGDEIERAEIWREADCWQDLLTTIAEYSDLLTRLAYTAQVQGRLPGVRH